MIAKHIVDPSAQPSPMIGQGGIVPPTACQMEGSRKRFWRAHGWLAHEVGGLRAVPPAVPQAIPSEVHTNE